MIHSIDSGSTTTSSRAFPTRHSLRHARSTHMNENGRSISPAVWPVLGFGHRPETNSLWDTGLLDRLTVPLTRYHE
jgi:hypothetical protein